MNSYPELEDIEWESDGVDEPSTDAVAVNATDYYTMTGMRADKNNLPDGFYIAVSHLSDGSIHSQKVLER